MTSDPTTGEIVRAFRGAGVYGITTALELRIIDRLESQDRTIAELKYQLELLSIGIPVQMKELTARAEQAERELTEYRKRYVKETYPTA